MKTVLKRITFNYMNKAVAWFTQPLLHFFIRFHIFNHERYCKAKNVAVYVSLLRAWNVFVYDDIYREPVRCRYRTRYDKLGWRNNLCGRNGSDKQFDSQKDELGIRAL